MPLVLVATAGAANANAYSDVAGADAVALYRSGPAPVAWLALTNDQKIQQLVGVTRDLDTSDFLGARATATQALEWPRTGTDYDSTILPPRLVMATIEQAILNAADLTADPLNVLDPLAAGIKRERVGPLETEYRDPTIQGGTAGVTAFDPRGLARFAPIVQRLLTPLVRSLVGSSWGSAEVVRGS